jgi:hypothetical protein
MNRNQTDPSFCRVEQPKAQPTGRIVHTTIKEKYSISRAIAAAYWISYFTLHWLTILGVVPHCRATSGATIYFLLSAIIASVMIAAHEAMEKKGE